MNLDINTKRSDFFYLNTENQSVIVLCLFVVILIVPIHIEVYAEVKLILITTVLL